MDIQNPLRKIGLDRCIIDIIRNGEASEEATVRTLNAVIRPILSRRANGGWLKSQLPSRFTVTQKGYHIEGCLVHDRLRFFEEYRSAYMGHFAAGTQMRMSQKTP